MEERVVAKQQYYSNYGSRGRRRRVKPRFYVFVTLIAILVMTGCFFANVAGQVKGLSMATVEPTYLDFEEIKTVKSWHNKEVKFAYLTFDDGPSENTKKIMDILAKYDAKATFFVTGRNQDYNYLIKDAYNAGHTIALHTYSHEYSTVYASVDAYFDDLNKVGQMVKKEIGFVPHYIRFPGGSSNTVSRRYCQGIMSTLTKEVVEKGYQYYDWNGDSTDASGNHVAVDKLIRNGTSCHDNNVMILCHDTQAKDTTVQALPAIIEHYKNLGYTFKGIDDATYAPHQSVNN